MESKVKCLNLLIGLVFRPYILDALSLALAGTGGISFAAGCDAKMQAVL